MLYDVEARVRGPPSTASNMAVAPARIRDSVYTYMYTLTCVSLSLSISLSIYTYIKRDICLYVYTCIYIYI